MDDPNAVDDDGVAYVDMKWEYLFTLGKYHAALERTDGYGFSPRLQQGEGREKRHRRGGRRRLRPDR